MLTDPGRHPVPVTPEQMAVAAKQAWSAGATVMHVHFRRQEAGRGHLPTWQPETAAEICDAIRQACPGVVLNLTTGVLGPDVSGPLACLERVQPEIAACNAGSLNYLKLRRDGQWAWPPMLFDNPVEKITTMLATMQRIGTRPEMECFDTGIVRSVGLYTGAGLLTTPTYNFVMGVASGMAADPELLDLLPRWTVPGTRWQVTAIGREEIWPLHQRAAELGGMLRTGLEDTCYLPSGKTARCNGELIEALADCARSAGREVASIADTRRLLDLPTL